MLADQRADAVDLEADVHTVGDGLFVAVLHNQILIEEAESLLRRRGGQPDNERIEILKLLPPEIVDGPVAFVGDDEVERLDGKAWVVADWDRLVFQERGFEAGLFLQFRIDLLSLQHGVEALNGSNADLADIIQLVRLHALDVVQLGEQTIFFRSAEFLELSQSLAPEIATVHKEQDALRPSVLDKPVDEVASRECLAAAAGHLNESTRTILGERRFQILDGDYLSRPQALRHELGAVAEAHPTT